MGEGFFVGAKTAWKIRNGVVDLVDDDGTTATVTNLTCNGHFCDPVANL